MATLDLLHAKSKRSTVFDEDTEEKLRDLARLFRISAARFIDDPFYGLLQTLTSFLYLGSSTLAMHTIDLFGSIPRLFSHLALGYHPDSPTSLAAYSLVPLILFHAPSLCSEFRKVSYLNILSQNSFLYPRYAKFLTSARTAVIFANKLDYGFKTIPSGISNYPRTTLLLRDKPLPAFPTEQDKLEASQFEFDFDSGKTMLDVKERPQRSIYSISDSRGVYRLYYGYNHVELADQYDIGVLNLKFDFDTWRVSGEGMDSLRGKFKVIDARSNETTAMMKDSKEQMRKEMKWLDSNDLGSDAALFELEIILKYELDNTRIKLSGSHSNFGFSGLMGFMDRGEEENHDEAFLTPEKSFGFWTMIHDYTTTEEKDDERKSEMMEEIEESIVEHMEAPASLRLGFPLVPYVRAVETKFEPWYHVTLDEGYCTSIRILSECSAMLAISQSSTFDVAWFANMASLQIYDDPKARIDHFPLPLGGHETELKYEARIRSWTLASMVIRYKLIDVAALYACDRLERALQRLLSDSPKERSDEVSFWCQLFGLRIEFIHSSHLFLASHLQIAAQEAARIEAEKNLPAPAPEVEDTREIDSSFMNTFGQIKDAGSNGHIQRRKLRKSASPYTTTIIASVLSIGLLVGIGAFMFGRISRKSTQH